MHILPLHAANPGPFTGAAVNAGMKALFVEPYLFLPKPYTVEQLTKSVAFLLLNSGPRPEISIPP